VVTKTLRMSFNLFSGEEIIVSTNNNVITVTNMRIRKEVRTWGNSYNQSILLQHITSCEVKYRSNPVFLILFGICLLVAGYLTMQPYNDYYSSSSPAAVPFVLSLSFLVVYIIDRHNYIVVASPSTKMFIRMQGGRDASFDFISKVEAAVVDLKTISSPG
jgi:hypothetical protein